MKRSSRLKSPSKKAIEAQAPQPLLSPSKRPNKKQKVTSAPPVISAAIPPTVEEVVEDFEEAEDEYDAIADATGYQEDDEERRQGIKFDCEVKVVFKNKEKGLERLEFDVTAIAVIRQAHNIAIEKTKGEGVVGRTKVTASYRGMKKDDAFAVDMKEDKDFDKCIDCLLAWDLDGREGFKVHITVFCEKSSQFAPIGRSATARQEAALPGVTAEQEEQGDYSARIRTKWTCEAQSCQNHTKGKFCYWVCSNTAENHYPITTMIAKDWSKEIKAGRLTEDGPSNELFNSLSKAKQQLFVSAYKGRQLAQQPQQDSSKQPERGFVQQQFFGISVQDMVLLQKGGVLPVKGDTTPPDRPSSAPTQTGPEELVTECFQTLAFQTHWHGSEDKLEEMKAVLIENGYDLDGISSISFEEWRSLGLKPGYLKRLQKSIVKFKSERKVHTSPSGSARSE